MLIESYELQIQVSPHSSEKFEYEAIAYLNADIGAALPYLNSTLSRGIYLPDKTVLSWRHEGRNIGFWANRIAVDNLESREEAREVVDHLVEMVNQVWAKRHELEPDTTTHPRLQPLELYRLLPQTNCGACGEETCFNFALKLVAGQVPLERCTVLFEQPAHEARREQLTSLLSTKWPAL